MIPNRRLILAASDPRLTLSVQTHLQKALQITAPVVRFDEVANLLAPDTDGDILLIAAEPSDIAAVEATIRETRVQQLPVNLSVLESEAVAGKRAFDHLTPYLSGRWLWPHHARELIGWARGALTAGVPFIDPVNESVAHKIRRKLVNHTPSLTTMVS